MSESPTTPTIRTLPSSSSRKKVWIGVSSAALVLMLAAIPTALYLLNQQQGTSTEASWPENLQEFIICAPNQCNQYPSEREVHQGVFEAGELILTGSITRNSGDEELNEHVLIFVDDTLVLSSYDRPGLPVDDVENFTVPTTVTSGIHTITVKHGDVSANPTSTGSVAVQISWEQTTTEPSPSPTPPQQAQCPLITIYRDGDSIGANQMVVGETITFAIKRDTSVLDNPSSARFSTDGGATWETTNVLNSSGEFVWDYEVPDATSVSITGQLCQGTTCI